MFNKLIFFPPVSLVSIFCQNEIIIIALNCVKLNASGDVCFVFWVFSNNFYSPKTANEYWSSVKNRLSYNYVTYDFTT